MLAKKIILVYLLLLGASLFIGTNIRFLAGLINFNRIENKSSEMKIVPEEVRRQMTFSQYDRNYFIPILIYHYVEYVEDEKDTIRKSLDTTPDVFENQIITLKEDGYVFLTMNEVGDIIEGKIDKPKKAVALTFDDGYRDFFSDVLPILKKYGVKATVYVISSFLDKPNYLFKDQLKEILKTGLVEIGAHTMRHENLKNKSSELVEKEVRGSREELEQLSKRPVTAFAYPFGAFDNQAITSVREAGFLTAVSTVEGAIQSLSNRFFMYRVRPGTRTGMSLLTYLDSMR